MSLEDYKLTKKSIKAFESMGILNEDDLLSHYPYRYDEIYQTPFDQWKMFERVTFEAILITKPTNLRLKKSIQMSKFMIKYDDQIFNAVIFNRPWICKLTVGEKIFIDGKYEGNHKIVVSKYNLIPINEQSGFNAVYSLKNNITQKIISSTITKIMENKSYVIKDYIPDNYKKKYRLCSKEDALKWIHFPANKQQIDQATRRIKYEEFLMFNLGIQLIKNQNLKLSKKLEKKFDFDAVFMLANCLNFSLTNDQLKVTNEILEDLKSNKLMYRLLQGDVGCGKTVVATLVLYATVLSSYQGALLCPTEILAKQHYQSLKNILKYTEVKVSVYYSSMSSISKKEILNDLKNGEIDILVGTHAIYQDDVIFNNLGLAIADEQHRFGVQQRRKLLNKGYNVDFLLMSATPIPRTLANILYGDMDISTIVTMPKGRKEVKTILIRENSFKSVLDDIIQKLQEGHQIYVVCSAILDEDRKVELKSTEEICSALKIYLKDFAKVDQLHGKMNSDEKDLVMKRFINKETNILVSTTVIEVGVNVVNATVMIVYDAHRFGLSQLHQLRGRVQRGNEQGICYLLTDSNDLQSIERLEILVNNNNGFDISKEDLRLRGAGDILGTRQSGVPTFILGNLITDSKIVDISKQDAIEIISCESNKENEKIIGYIKSCNEKEIKLID
ncbi:MAG: ATP-dependent DNA helicase RecG [Anaerorhabdus sp.]